MFIRKFEKSFERYDTPGEEKREVAKSMNENVEQCKKGGQMWSNVAKRGNNERYMKERRDWDDDKYVKFGLRYRDNERFRGRSTRRF